VGRLLISIVLLCLLLLLGDKWALWNTLCSNVLIATGPMPHSANSSGVPS
jgi:hypothetical protein